MPSPFPGMDPYLEEPSIWSDLHSTLINYIREALQPQIRPKYIARIGEHIEVTELGKGYVPDVMVVEPPNNPSRSIHDGGVLVADVPQIFRIAIEPFPTPFIEIIYRETGDVVTVIKVLSPINKTGDGRRQYIKKQEELFKTQANLVEIDLLKVGQRTTLARDVDLQKVVDWRYVVSVSRWLNRDKLEVYPFAIKDPLPVCRIPLRTADGDAILDLPSVFTRCYEVGGYDLLINYKRLPPIPLSNNELEWVAAHLESINKF